MSAVTKLSVGVVYLARSAEGIDAFKRFAASYRRYPSGCDHDLIILYKGFSNQSDLQEARSVFSDLPHIALELQDLGFDIGSYLEASHRVSHRYLFFANTYSELAADGWLKLLMNHATREGVGVAAAMGSYESLFNSFAIIQSVIWMCNFFRVPYDKDLHNYCDFIINLYAKDWCAADQIRRFDDGQSPNFRSRIRRTMKVNASVWASRARWWLLTRQDKVFADYGRFPAFPNPHIRSNGFLIDRERLLSLGDWSLQTKLDACFFESGAGSFTNRLRRAGLGVVTVDREGKGYDVKDWWRSRLFRLGNQEGLLLTDNQSRGFDAMSSGARVTHTRMTWGDYIGPAPDNFPRLAFQFPSGPLSIDRMLLIRQLRACGLPL